MEVQIFREGGGGGGGSLSLSLSVLHLRFREPHGTPLRAAVAFRVARQEEQMAAGGQQRRVPLRRPRRSVAAGARACARVCEPQAEEAVQGLAVEEKVKPVRARGRGRLLGRPADRPPRRRRRPRPSRRPRSGGDAQRFRWVGGDQVRHGERARARPVAACVRAFRRLLATLKFLCFLPAALGRGHGQRRHVHAHLGSRSWSRVYTKANTTVANA
jgi:hypothetical protein